MMPYRVQWGNDERTIIHEIYEGVLTVEDYYQASEETNRLLDTVPHAVDVIADASRITLIKGNMLNAARQVSLKSRPNQRMVVVVKPDLMIEILISIITKLFPGMDIRTVKTLEEAYAFIASRAVLHPK